MQIQNPISAPSSSAIANRAVVTVDVHRSMCGAETVTETSAECFFTERCATITAIHKKVVAHNSSQVPFDWHVSLFRKCPPVIEMDVFPDGLSVTVGISVQHQSGPIWQFSKSEHTIFFIMPRESNLTWQYRWGPLATRLKDGQCGNWKWPTWNFAYRT